MRKLVLTLAVLAVTLLVVDRWASGRAEQEVEAAIEGRVAGVGGVDASIDSLPFLGRLLVAGQVSRLDVRLTDIGGYGLAVAELHVVGDRIRLDRDLLLGEQQVKVRDVGTVRATATISETEIRRATGVQVDLLAGGEARVTVGGVTATATASVADGRIRFTLDGLPAVTVPVPTTALLPCTPAVEVVADAVVASCEADRLPDILAAAIGG